MPSRMLEVELRSKAHRAERKAYKESKQNAAGSWQKEEKTVLSVKCWENSWQKAVMSPELKAES